MKKETSKPKRHKPRNDTCVYCGEKEFEQIQEKIKKQEYARSWYLKNQEAFKEKRRLRYLANKKQECETRKKYYEKNRDKILQYSKKWSEKNKERLKIINRIWAKNNPDKVKAKIQRYSAKHKDRIREMRKIYASTPKAKLINSLRCATKRIAYYSGAKKKFPTVKLLGCSFKEAKEYLESKFKDGMNWDNFGKWHIDHIRPLASFDLTDVNQQLIAGHYTNLQPLWASENISKGSKYEKATEKKYQKA
jgi:hypothetical protein